MLLKIFICVSLSAILFLWDVLAFTRYHTAILYKHQCPYTHRSISLVIIAILDHCNILFFSWCYSSLDLTIYLFHLFIVKGYVSEFEIVDDHRSGKIVVELTGRLNKCGVISPRFDVPYDDIEGWIVNLLPSRQFRHLILTTT